HPHHAARRDQHRLRPDARGQVDPLRRRLLTEAALETISTARSFGGTQGVYRHDSEACGCAMTFALFLPPQAAYGPVPLLWYLSGLTCTHQNVMDKGEYRRLAAELGLAVICPDTSPRGDDVADEPDNWQFGKGAGFYLDATQAPYARH